MSVTCFDSLDVRDTMWRVAFQLVFALVLFSRPVIADDKQDPNEEAAKQHFQEGSEFFEQKKFEDAVRAFRAAYEIKPTWKLHYNIAQAETAAKRYGLALEQFESYLAKGGDDVLADREQEVLREIDRLRLLVGVLEVDASPGTEVYVDAIHRGTVPLKGLIRVAVGDHHVTMKYAGKAIFSRRLKIAGGVHTWVYARLPDGEALPDDDTDVSGGPRNREVGPVPDEGAADDTGSDAASDGGSDEGNRSQEFISGKLTARFKDARFRRTFLISGIATAGVGVLGLAMGVGFTVAAAKKADERDGNAKLYEDTGERIYLDQAEQNQSDLELRQNWMVTGYVVGGVLTAAGGALLVFWFIKNRKQKLQSEKVAIWPGANGVVLTF